jgi:hypothetical protein
METQKANKNYFRTLRGYMNATISNFKSAMNEVVPILSDKVQILSDKSTYAEIGTAMYSVFMMHWISTFQENQAAISSEWAKKGYSLFRKDRSIFRGKRQFTMPDGTVKKIDGAEMSVIEQIFVADFAQRDLEYMNTMFTGEHFQQDMTQWVEANYHLLPLNRNIDLAIDFRKKLGTYLLQKTGGISNLLRNTVAVMRGVANLAYLQQVNVPKFKLAIKVESERCLSCTAPDTIMETPMAYNNIKSVAHSSKRDPESKLSNLINTTSKCAGGNCLCKITAVLD